MNKITHALMSILFTPVYQDQDILICYASQTGTAANLAAQSGDIVKQMGRSVNVQSLSSLQPSDFNYYNQVLMIVSTCGEGEIPDDGKLFYELLKGFPDLSVPVSLLALGDHSYSKFCLAGKLMHQELIRMGAVDGEFPVMVSGNPIEIWRDWLSKQLNQEIDAAQTKALSRPVKLVLSEKQSLHNKDNKHMNTSNEAYQLTFDIEGADHYKVNDLVAILPPGSDKERLYSIASSPTASSGKQISLCIARHQFMLDGELRNGACSDYLIQQLSIGSELDASIKPGAGLPLPQEDAATILISTGAGIAPMMAVLEERKQCAHTGKNWFIFGNRHSEGDFYYKDRLMQYLDDGDISQLNTAFSRDAGQKVYVQNRLEQQQEQLAEWLLDLGAQVYVCGRPELKDEILMVIRHSLEAHLADHREADQYLNSMLQNGRITFELF